MSGLGIWAVETLIATTLVMLLVLVLRAPVRRAFGAHIGYALWLLPVLRLVLPPLPGDWRFSRLLAPFTHAAADAPGVVVGIMNPATIPDAARGRAVQAGLELGGHRLDMALVPPTPVAGAPNMLVLLLGLWVIGAGMFLAYHLIAHRRYCARLLSRARADRTVAEGKVRVIETDAAHGPLAFGIFRKYVAFPRDFAERYDPQERDLALAHELGHHVRGDLIANWVALVVLALHWFNPVAWRAFRAFRADQEMACDALVLAGRARALRHAYGRAIVKSAHGGAVSAACHLHTINEVKGRLRMLSNIRKNSPVRIATGLAGVGAVTLAALGVTASASQAAEQIRRKVQVVTGVTTQETTVSDPARPALPAPPHAPAHPADASAAAPAADQDRGDNPVRTMVVVKKDGTRAEVQMPDTQAMLANVPDVRNVNCGGGKGQPAVEHRKAGAKQVIIICQDRIERMAGDAARAAIDGKQVALTTLHSVREAMAANAALSAEQRAEALREIDEAIVEVQTDRDDGSDD